MCHYNGQQRADYIIHAINLHLWQNITNVKPPLDPYRPLEAAMFVTSYDVVDVDLRIKTFNMILSFIRDDEIVIYLKKTNIQQDILIPLFKSAFII